jgi:hypothetical protein
MFVGAVNNLVRSALWKMSEGWTGRRVVVACSGNFTVERIMAARGIREIHGNDVSLYSCALGAHLAGKPFPLRIKDERYSFLEPFVADTEKAVATLMLCTEWFKFADRPGMFYERMDRQYRDDFPAKHDATVERIRKACDGVKLTTFTPADCVDYLRDAPRDAVAISFPPTYCLAPHERILTADLRWVPCGELSEGDEILAFDEEPKDGNRCRRWRFAKVTMSRPARKQCVRVNLENGDSIICSKDHPWLVDRYNGSGRRDWVRADSIEGMYALRELDTWEAATSYEAGWLAGMFDGEGSLNLGTGPKLVMVQAKGALTERFSSLLGDYSLDYFVCNTTGHENGKEVKSINIKGGFPEMLRALGMLRPTRLLNRFRELDIGSRSVRSHGNSRVKVVSVERIGERPVQSISTSTKTFVGEGYLMHNTAGYERLYKKLDAVFGWDSPAYTLFDEDRFAEFESILREFRTWVTLTDYPREDLMKHCVGVVQTGLRSRPVYLYASDGPTTVAFPHQKLAQNPYPIARETVESPLKLVEISQAVMNQLRSMYLSPKIVPAGAQCNFAVLADGKLIGAIGFSKSNYLGNWCDAYMMTDFCVRPNPHKRLSKLILAAVLSTEVRVALEQAFGMRVRSIGTTAFTDRPVSMKYRGMFDLAARKEGKLNYTAQAGKWTLQEGMEWWMLNHANVLAA